MMMDEYSWQVLLGPLEDPQYAHEGPTFPLELLLGREDEIVLDRSQIPKAVDQISTMLYICYGDRTYAAVQYGPLQATFRVSLEEALDRYSIIDVGKLLYVKTLQEALVETIRLVWAHDPDINKDKVDSFLRAIQVSPEDFWK